MKQSKSLYFHDSDFGFSSLRGSKFKCISLSVFTFEMIVYIKFFCLLAQVKVDQNQAAELLKNQSQSQVGVYGTCLQNQYMKAMLLNSALCGKERSILPVDSQLLFVGYITVLLKIKKKTGL